MPSEISAADLRKLKSLDKQLTTIVNRATAKAIAGSKGIAGGKRRRRKSTGTKKTTHRRRKH